MSLTSSQCTVLLRRVNYAGIAPHHAAHHSTPPATTTCPADHTEHIDFGRPLLPFPSSHHVHIFKGSAARALRSCRPRLRPLDRPPPTWTDCHRPVSPALLRSSPRSTSRLPRGHHHQQLSCTPGCKARTVLPLSHQTTSNKPPPSRTHRPKAGYSPASSTLFAFFIWKRSAPVRRHCRIFHDSCIHSLHQTDSSGYTTFIASPINARKPSGSQCTYRSVSDALQRWGNPPDLATATTDQVVHFVWFSSSST